MSVSDTSRIIIYKSRVKLQIVVSLTDVSRGIIRSIVQATGVPVMKQKGMLYLNLLVLIRWGHLDDRRQLKTRPTC
jgi:hypothetical protein